MFSLGETMDFLIGNPFSSPVGQRIERATSGSLQSEDWGLNMEICDIINETDEGPRDAVKAVKKRIVGNKNFREIMLALTVLEACVKNCGHRFHVLVASQDFVESVLVRSILPKYNPPTALHDRVLSLIQSWADAFRSSPSLSGVVYVYDDLRRRGLEFPMTDLDALSPIHTPNRSIPDNGTSESTPAAAPAPAEPPGHGTTPPERHGDGTPSLSAAQEQKLRGELALVRGNLSVMSDILNEVTPGRSSPDDADLLQQLFSTCKNMQTRVVELVPQLQHEGLIQELLVVNDDLNNTFIRYERFDRLNKAQTAAAAVQNVSSAFERKSESTPSLKVGFSPQSCTASAAAAAVEPSAVTQPQAAVIATSSQTTVSRTSTAQQQSAKRKDEEEFDMFAQTRSSSLADQRKSVRYEDPGAVEGLAGALDSRLQVVGGAQVCVESEADKWLLRDAADEGSAVCEGVTSEDFDKFLEARAKAADFAAPMVRDVPPSSSSSSSSRPPPPPSSGRQQDASHDQLFSL
ncbi:unnamed protein product [Ophioblennius macclurei]